MRRECMGLGRRIPAADSCSGAGPRVDASIVRLFGKPSVLRLEEPERPRTRLRPGSGVVGGWLIFLAGLGMLGAVVLIPAQSDLARTRQARDAMLLREQVELRRIDRHRQYLHAYENGDPRLLRSLAMSQFNMTPVDRKVLLAPGGPGDLELFGPIEPTTRVGLIAGQEPSRLAQLATDRRTRLWLIAGAVWCLFVGLLPPSR